ARSQLRVNMRRSSAFIRGEGTPAAVRRLPAEVRASRSSTKLGSKKSERRSNRLLTSSNPDYKFSVFSFQFAVLSLAFPSFRLSDNAGAFLLHVFCLVMGHILLKDCLEFAVHDLLQLVNRQSDA